MGEFLDSAQDNRQCPGCGRFVAGPVEQCPFCREPLPVIPDIQRYGPRLGGPEMRRGVLYMLLAAVIYYFAAGYSPLEFPYPYSRWMTSYALPLLFLAGFGLLVYGFYRRAAG